MPESESDIQMLIEAVQTLTKSNLVLIEAIQGLTQAILFAPPRPVSNPPYNPFGRDQIAPFLPPYEPVYCETWNERN